MKKFIVKTQIEVTYTLLAETLEEAEARWENGDSDSQEETLLAVGEVGEVG